MTEKLHSHAVDWAKCALEAAERGDAIDIRNNLTNFRTLIEECGQMKAEHGEAKVEIFLETSGDDGVGLGVRLPNGAMMWMDADDGLVPHEMVLETGNGRIFDNAGDALTAATPYIKEKLKGMGW